MLQAEGDKDAEAPASQPQSTADTKVGEEKSTDMEQETRGEGVAVKEEARMQQR